jgi:hypothetical protein
MRGGEEIRAGIRWLGPLLAWWETVEDVSPFFDGEVFCLGSFLGDSCGSGYNLGFDGEAKSREVFDDSGTTLSAV